MRRQELWEDGSWAGADYKTIITPAVQGVRGRVCLRLHHVVKDSSPAIYWYAVSVGDHGHITFDIRKMWGLTGSVAAYHNEAYSRFPADIRIDYVADFLQRRVDAGVDIINLIKHSSEVSIDGERD